jgi:hypothetical protein
MSIHHFFRSSRTNRRRGTRGSEKGQAMVLALLLVLFVLPIGITLYKFVQQSSRASVQDSHQKTSIGYANGVIMDYMRQFSQDPYNGHYDAASLARNNFLYQNGFSTVTYVADPVNHNVYLDATGVFTGGGGRTQRRIEAVIHFQSMLTKFGTMINGPITLNTSGVTYNGGMWIGGALTLGGSNMTWNGGPVIVNGSVLNGGGANKTLNGNLYCSGAAVNGLTVTGNTYNFVPPFAWPTIDPTYFNANSTYVSNAADRTIIFNSNGTFTVVGGATYAIPSTGAILYCNNCNFTVHGVVSGRATVVATGAAKGAISVNSNLFYAGASSMTATAANSFAALATNSIAFSTTQPNNLYVAGTYFVQQGTLSMSLTGGGGTQFWLNGVRTSGISNGGGFGQVVISYDSKLMAYPPPGLPESPMLVNYRVH